jgi:hypothetical protein
MQKSTRAVVLKDADSHYEQLLFYNFLQLSKVLSVDARASASKIEKMAKNSKKIRIFEILSKVEYLCLFVASYKAWNGNFSYLAFQLPKTGLFSRFEKKNLRCKSSA